MKSSKWAQNRIDYIVHHNPRGVRKLIHDFGFIPPDHPMELALTTRELVRTEGQDAVRGLLAIHPDRGAIEAVQEEEEDSFCPACQNHSFNPEDNFCGSCGHSNYDGRTAGEFATQLAEMNAEALQDYYQHLMKKATDHPSDQRLGEEVRVVWNELRQRRKEKVPAAQGKTCGCQGKKASTAAPKQDAWVWISLLVMAGMLVGSSLGKSSA